MKITKVDIPEAYEPHHGLGAIQMDRLGQLVIIAGRNGSGKTRLLNKVARAFTSQPTAAQREKYETQIEVEKRNISQFTMNLGKHKGMRFEEAIRRSEDAILRVKKELQKYVLHIHNDLESHKSLYFVPKNLSLTDPKDLNEKYREQKAKAAHRLGIEEFHDRCLPKIQDLHIQYWHATHQDSQITPEDKKAICDEYSRLQDNIEKLLGVRLGNDPRGSATIFGFPIGEANLSDGQKVLLQLATAIHCQGSEISDTILFLDEPENHIHPAAIIETLETIIANIPDGQVWIATHSVSLLAHFSSESSLWYMDNGKVSHAGKIQEKVLEGLLGDESRIARQKDFLEKPEQLALTRYVQECISPPSVVMTKPGDPQVGQIRAAINSVYQSQGKIKVLDYGAGQGRFLANIVEDGTSVEEIASCMDYVALDESTAHQETCAAHISKVYGSADTRWYNTHHDLIASHNKGSFHLIVLCNVLHEIPPKRWEALFGASGEITELLAEDGQLLIVEDQRIPVGESAHKHGFIVLDTCSLKDLFAIQGNDPSILEDSQRGGRLKAHLVGKSQLSKVSRDTVRKALRTHSSHSKSEIDRIRKNGEGGRLFAFWLVQFANSTMALEEDYGS